MSTMLTVSHLTKSFGQRLIIDDLSFSIEAGNRVTLFAPSGSGKTTLINILNGFDRDYRGQAQWAARNPVTLFQESRLFAHLTIGDNILFPMTVKGKKPTAEVRRRLADWLAVCEIEDQITAYPYQLSGGSRQKVALIRGLLVRPDLAIMDEPFKSIDITSKIAIIRHIIAEHPEMTILLVTHNLEEIPLLSKSLMVFRHRMNSDFTVYPDVTDSPFFAFVPRMIEGLLD